MSEVHLIILVAEDMSHTDDSVTITADCGHKCWIAPSGLAMVLDTGINTATKCIRCIDPAKLRGTEIRAVPGSREEVAKEIGEEATARFWEGLHG